MIRYGLNYNYNVILKPTLCGITNCLYTNCNQSRFDSYTQSCLITIRSNCSHNTRSPFLGWNFGCRSLFKVHPLRKTNTFRSRSLLNPILVSNFFNKFWDWKMCTGLIVKRIPWHVSKNLVQRIIRSCNCIIQFIIAHFPFFIIIVWWQILMIQEHWVNSLQLEVFFNLFSYVSTHVKNFNWYVKTSNR